ncbi:hypothetical protein BOTCAL_0293g00100 [Botryotinia calthae]|uniref:Uncharacterized protein n=1 Tax=Botryotinia calthae TaxID=38488 RepID=A0A4Y8CXF2_9HELO|nr:hypothetical protein BOTCAL_0293g00100 [Botryotinia calthae]
MSGIFGADSSSSKVCQDGDFTLLPHQLSSNLTLIGAGDYENVFYYAYKATLALTTIASETSTPIEQAEQFLQYVKAQRMYATLLERYNPGMNMDEEERVRLTARRVGMDLPEEFSYGRDGNGGKVQ